MIDKPGWGGVESEVLTRKRPEYVPPPPPDLSAALTDDARLALKAGFGGKPVGPGGVPLLSRAALRRKQEAEEKERAKRQARSTDHPEHDRLTLNPSPHLLRGPPRRRPSLGRFLLRSNIFSRGYRM